MKKFFPESTIKSLAFINDEDLSDTIQSVLTEIDSTSAISANRSTVYLSVSMIEGILKNVLDQNKKRVISVKNYPTLEKGGIKKRIPYRKFKLQQFIQVAKELKLFSHEYSDIYEKARSLRNYMHPQAEIKKDEKITIGMAQLCLGLLNNLIENLNKKRFINTRIWHVISGSPRYFVSGERIRLNKGELRTNSFMVTYDLRSKDFEMSFELVLLDRAVFNFVFNMDNLEKFDMIRIDSRNGENVSLLKCSSKYNWAFYARSDFNIEQSNRYKIRIKVSKNVLAIFINGSKPKFSKPIPKYLRTKRVGFFNELVV